MKTTLAIVVALSAFITAGISAMYPDDARTVFPIAFAIVLLEIVVWLAARVSKLEESPRPSENRNQEWTLLEEKETTVTSYSGVTQAYHLNGGNKIDFQLSAKSLLRSPGFFGTLERYCGPDDGEFEADNFELVKGFDGMGRWRGTFTIHEPGIYSFFVTPKKEGQKLTIRVTVLKWQSRFAVEKIA